jgi:DNA-binding Xre family transcriptional regulator
MTVTQFSDVVGLTLANLSILKTRALHCQLGDILTYDDEETA